MPLISDLRRQRQANLLPVCRFEVSLVYIEFWDSLGCIVKPGERGGGREGGNTNQRKKQELYKKIP